MLVMTDQEQLNLGLLAAGMALVLLAILWRMRRSRSARKKRAPAPAVDSATPMPDFTRLYDQLVESEATDTPVDATPSGDDQPDLPQAADPAPDTAEPENRKENNPVLVMATKTGAVVLNDFRKALNDGLDLPSAARKHGLTEDEARVATLCYSPPGA